MALFYDFLNQFLSQLQSPTLAFLIGGFLVAALYPFMDIPALILAIILATVHKEKGKEGSTHKVNTWAIVKESLRGSALSAMILGLLIGLVGRPETVLESFYEPLFRGMLSILMLILGMEAWSRIRELLSVAHWYVLYACIGPIVHGLIAFGLGYLAHLWMEFSPGGAVLILASFRQSIGIWQTGSLLSISL